MKQGDLLILAGIGALILLKGKGGPEELGGGGSGPIQVLGSPTESFGQVDQSFSSGPLGEGEAYVAGFQQNSYEAVKTKLSELSDPNQYAQYGNGLVIDKSSGLIKFVGGAFAGFAGVNVPLAQTPGQKYGELIPASFEDPLVLKSIAQSNKGKSKSKSVPKKNNTKPINPGTAIPGVNYSPANNVSKACTYTKLDGTCG